MASVPEAAVLAIQGDYALHARALESAGARAVLARTPSEVLAASHLVLPGGESTTYLKFFEFEPELEAAIREFHASGRPIFATCAGAILLAREVRSPAQRSLGLIDLVVERNAYGRQVKSFSTSLPCPLVTRSSGDPAPLDAVFIRAPIIRAIGSAVEALASLETPVLVREANVLAATFHPELGADVRVHRYFVAMAGAESRQAAPATG